MNLTDIKKIVKEIFPEVTGIEGTINGIKRDAAIEAIKILKEKHGLDAVDPQKCIELENKIKYYEKANEDLENRLKITEGVRSHLATELQKLHSGSANCANASEDEIEHIVNARVQRVLEEHKAFEKYGPWDKAKMGDYMRLVQQERAVITGQIKAITMTAQVLHQDVVIRFSKNNSFVVLYDEDGRRIVMRWRDFFTFCYQDGEYNPGPYTHYCIVPNIKLEDLTGAPNNEKHEIKTDIQK